MARMSLVVVGGAPGSLDGAVPNSSLHEKWPQVTSSNGQQNVRALNLFQIHTAQAVVSLMLHSSYYYSVTPRPSLHSEIVLVSLASPFIYYSVTPRPSLHSEHAHCAC